MLKSVFKLALVATALVVAVKANDVQAAVSTPAVVGAIATMPAQATPVHWVCGEFRCVWKPDHRGPIHPWAREWRAPRHANCVYERVGRGPWIEVCR